jgi:hypothetical protein
LSEDIYGSTFQAKPGRSLVEEQMVLPELQKMQYSRVEDHKVQENTLRPAPRLISKKGDEIDYPYKTNEIKLSCIAGRNESSFLSNLMTIEGRHKEFYKERR